MTAESPSHSEKNPYGSSAGQSGPERIAPGRIRTHHMAQFKEAGQRFTMLTAYDASIAGVFEEAGVELLLVGDSAANVMMKSGTTLPITVDEMLVFARSVVNGVSRPLVVADLPFGSYEASPQQALGTAVRFMKEAGVQAVKIEGGSERAETIRTLVGAGIPVMGHVGFTPQAEHALGGYRVQGRGDAGQKVIDDAVSVEEAGAFAVVMEMVPAAVAAEADEKLSIPTIGIGAGNVTTGQVLVWQDMLGLNAGRVPRFVKQYTDLRSVIADAVGQYRAEVESGEFPAEEHSF
ncbi:3-methyl-2-oxobutanoate hydroxymethyltransferase [Nesterenkonia populi]|uniref:3-methyl-2-oxobutanoate hydroxymethyltransferase n=1 Tax=Nesterenkonia populi TaxID=1591087 RepID=UPI0011BF01C4|nr:3-methyl-2-oxobutanoate hydroxymethyltransferase [Nesterenkonia populi]